MHNFDRTQQELEVATEQEQAHEHEHEVHGESVLGELFAEAEQEAHEHEAHEHETHEHEAHEQELEAEAEAEQELEAEAEAEQAHEAESPLSEAQELELAAELLEVSSEAELEYFLGNLFKKAVSGVKAFARSSVGRALGGALKGVAKKVLPIAGTAVGGYFGGPIGAKLGSGLGKLASNLFELELEGLSHEDREFEVARRFVQLGAAAARNAARAPRTLSPRIAARRALGSAARIYAPGLLRRRPACAVCAAAGRRTLAVARPRRPLPVVGTTMVRRPDGATRVVTRRASGEPVYAEPAPSVVDTGVVDGDDRLGFALPRSGRWVRRGQKIVLLGV